MAKLWIVENKKVLEITPIGRKSYPKKRTFIVYKVVKPITNFLEDGSVVASVYEVVEQVNIKKTFNTKQDAIDSIVSEIKLEINGLQTKINLLTKEIEILRE